MFPPQFSQCLLLMFWGWFALYIFYKVHSSGGDRRCPLPWKPQLVTLEKKVRRSDSVWDIEDKHQHSSLSAPPVATPALQWTLPPAKCPGVHNLVLLAINNSWWATTLTADHPMTHAFFCQLQNSNQLIISCHKRNCEIMQWVICPEERRQPQWL